MQRNIQHHCDILRMASTRNFLILAATFGQRWRCPFTAWWLQFATDLTPLVQASPYGKLGGSDQNRNVLVEPASCPLSLHHSALCSAYTSIKHQVSVTCKQLSIIMASLESLTDIWCAKKVSGTCKNMFFSIENNNNNKNAVLKGKFWYCFL